MVDQELQCAEDEGSDLEVRRVRAWRLRLSGYSIQDIADEMNCSVSTAHGYIKWAMENLPSAYTTAEEFRHVSLSQLEQQYKRLVEMDTEGSVRVALQVKDMQAKLLGAYAPTKVDATVKTQYQIVGVDTEQL